MQTTRRNSSPHQGRAAKRARFETGDTVLTPEDLLDEFEPQSPGEVVPLLVSSEPQDMKPENITHYMEELPAVTQHYDFETLYWLTFKDAVGWSEKLEVWRELRGCQFNVFDIVDNRPDIKGGNAAPPISALKLRLRAVVTYKALVTQAKEREVHADITLALAKKLLDYLLQYDYGL